MSIEKKLTYLKNTKALIRKKLNRFGINVSSENTFRSYVDFLDEILNRYPKSRGQGTSITLENTIEAPFTIFDVEGNSEQESTKGYQLLKYPYVASSVTVEGVTFTDNGDGSIRINGTASKEARFNLQWDNKVPAGSYSCIVFNLPNNCFANYYTIGNKYGEDVGNRTSDTEINLGSSIVVPAGVTVSNVTVYPMLVSGTYTRETIPNWEKYTGGIASPNPNYEQPILSSGDNGFINEKIKNADGTQEQTYTIPVQQPMRSIGDVRDLFFKNTVDSPYYDENLTLNGWYEVHKIGRKIFDGTENWIYLDSRGNYYRFYLINFSSGAGIKPVVSNFFIDRGNSAIGEYDFVQSSGNEFYLQIENKTSVAQLKNYLAEQYASGNPVYVDYILAEPLDLPCTETQIQQLENKPSTYKDFTIINSEDETEAYLEVAGLKED